MPIKKSDLFNAKAFKQSLENQENPLPLFREALRNGRETLKQQYHSGAKPDDIVYSNAWLVDQLIVLAFRQHAHLIPLENQLSLIAVGGYGRGELHPASDIDLMLLLHGDLGDSVNEFVETFIRFLWDIGLEVGHSVRTIKDCVQEAKKDITVATNLMETRLLLGDQSIFEKMQEVTGPAKLWPSRKFFAAKWEEQIQRHHRFDDTGYNLEPNIKEGPGGLRDIQMISWVTQREFGTASLDELIEHGFLTKDEYRSLIKGRNYLWHVRNGLHFLADRREDRLVFDHQRALAAEAGFEDQPGKLAVEQFMKRYYRTIKELSLLNEILLQHFEEAILSRGKPRTRPINRRFRAHGNFLETTSDRVFERSPWAILELFLLLQQQPKLKGVRAQTIRQVRHNLRRIDKKFREDLRCRSLFMEILRQPHGITHELRRMNAYGVLGAYLPAFGRVVGQMQHDLFHVYTVDEHTLFVLRNVRRFTVPEFTDEFPLASSIIQNLVKPERLYIAALYHDIAKGRGGDHSELGEQDARKFCEQHALSEYDTRFVCWLVRNHLVMSMVAQRQDIQDPDVIMEFAQNMGDKEHLDNLYLLTVADMRGTSPKVWNEWKRGLLSQLYQETARMIRRGFGKAIDVDEHLRELKQETLELLETRRVAKSRIGKIWDQMEDDYFLRHNPRSLSWHAEEIAKALVTDLPVVAVTTDPVVGGTEIMIYTTDRVGQFSAITGAIDKLGLSVVDARLHPTHNGYLITTFIVLDMNGNAVVDKHELKELKQNLHDELIADREIQTQPQTRLSRQQKHFPVQTRINFSPSANGQQTVLEVSTQDRPGLLHQLALALVANRVNITTARIATYGERAEDIFFVTDRNGEPVNDVEIQKEIESQIRQRLDGQISPS
jgi:[protein-PII] uridylyltransferase